MREIKFRTWQAGRFHYWGFIKSRYINEYDFRGIAGTSAEPLSMTEKMNRSQQYTGLKDKNGKEIYEGDTVKYVEPHTEHVEIRPIEWNGNGFWMVRVNGSVHLPCEEYREVIGNIYENPEQ
ncbi:hypothetical protein ES703_34076 [subsurface metagenome]